MLHTYFIFLVYNFSHNYKQCTFYFFYYGLKINCFIATAHQGFNNRLCFSNLNLGLEGFKPDSYYSLYTRKISYFTVPKLNSRLQNKKENFTLATAASLLDLTANSVYTRKINFRHYSNFHAYAPLKNNLELNKKDNYYLIACTREKKEDKKFSRLHEKNNYNVTGVSPDKLVVNSFNKLEKNLAYAPNKNMAPEYKKFSISRTRQKNMKYFRAKFGVKSKIFRARKKILSQPNINATDRLKELKELTISKYLKNLHNNYLKY